MTEKPPIKMLENSGREAYDRIRPNFARLHFYAPGIGSYQEYAYVTRYSRNATAMVLTEDGPLDVLKTCCDFYHIQRHD